ncbi:hypothetical protein O9K51_04713 [Purpureocillium lavendulum]|uniref:Uncharacterized protein n=1 Tax=Purpureocillium lavendulum TaxID=1247861 RepID=A0AB34FWP7_9HYPO|nr:hypothetical protein O9K51_04713 [Purpureocillium lavendulum]
MKHAVLLAALFGTFAAGDNLLWEGECNAEDQTCHKYMFVPGPNGRHVRTPNPQPMDGNCQAISKMKPALVLAAVIVCCAAITRKELKGTGQCRKIAQTCHPYFRRDGERRLAVDVVMPKKCISESPCTKTGNFCEWSEVFRGPWCIHGGGLAIVCITSFKGVDDDSS